MKLNHLDLTVSNVPDAHKFLEKYFGLKGYNGMEPRDGMSFMSDDSGMLLALFRAGKGTDAKYPAGFHIGFMQDTREQVQALYNQLKSGGIELGRPPGKIRNSYAFYFHFDQVFIEVGCIDH